MMVTERCPRGADMVNASVVERIAAGMALLRPLSLRLSTRSRWEPVSWWQEVRKFKLIMLRASGATRGSPCSETEVSRAHPGGMSRLGHLLMESGLVHEQREHGGECLPRGDDMLSLFRLLACAMAGHEWEWGTLAPQQVTNAMDWARYLRSVKCRRCARPWVSQNLKKSLPVEESWNA